MAIDLTKPKQGFGLIEAGSVGAGKGDDAHIIRVRHYVSGTTSVTPKTVCGVKRKETPQVIFTCETENELRTALAERKNNGLNICGRCVASFY